MLEASLGRGHCVVAQRLVHSPQEPLGEVVVFSQVLLSHVESMREDDLRVVYVSYLALAHAQVEVGNQQHLQSVLEPFVLIQSDSLLLRLVDLIENEWLHDNHSPLGLFERVLVVLLLQLNHRHVVVVDGVADNLSHNQGVFVVLVLRNLLLQLHRLLQVKHCVSVVVESKHSYNWSNTFRSSS